MVLKKGSSPKVVAYNVSKEMNSGKSRKASTKIALNLAEKAKKEEKLKNKKK